MKTVGFIFPVKISWERLTIPEDFRSEEGIAAVERNRTIRVRVDPEAMVIRVAVAGVTSQTAQQVATIAARHPEGWLGVHRLREGALAITFEGRRFEALRGAAIKLADALMRECRNHKTTLDLLYIYS